MTQVDEAMLREANDRFALICERARDRRQELGRRRASQVEEDREWLVHYTELLRARLAWLAGK